MHFAGPFEIRVNQCFDKGRAGLMFPFLYFPSINKEIFRSEFTVLSQPSKRISSERNRFCHPMQPGPEFYTIYGSQEPSRNRVVVLARQATQPGGTGSLESILGLLKSLKFGLRAWRAVTTALFLLGSQPPQIVLKFNHSSLISQLPYDVRYS